MTNAKSGWLHDDKKVEEHWGRWWNGQWCSWDRNLQDWDLFQVLRWDRDFVIYLFSPACTTFLPKLCYPITRQAIELESCSNPLRIQQVL